MADNFINTYNAVCLRSHNVVIFIFKPMKYVTFNHIYP